MLKGQSQCTVLVIRPDPSGSILCALLEAEGLRAIHLPTIIFAPPSDPNWQQALSSLAEQNWLIFMSPQAVYASIPAIRHRWPILPDTVKFAAVGGSTAAALHQAGYLVSLHPKADWSSEGLLNLPEFQQVSGQSIAIIRGEGGLDMLDTTLKTRGAHILPVLVYQRQLPKIDPAPYIHMIQSKHIDVIVAASFESIQHLMKLFDQSIWPDLYRIPLIVVSQRIKSLAHHLGFQTIWIAKNAKHDSILTTLLSHTLPGRNRHD